MSLDSEGYSAESIAIASPAPSVPFERFDAAEIARELENNVYLRAACEHLGITEPKIFSRKVMHAHPESLGIEDSMANTEVDYYEAFISQKQANFSDQVQADNFRYLYLYVKPNEGEQYMVANIYDWDCDPEAVRVPILSYEDALENLLSSNAFGVNDNVDLTRASILSVRLFYREYVFPNKYEGCYVPCYEFVLKYKNHTDQRPRTRFCYLPACQVSLDFSA